VYRLKKEFNVTTSLLSPLKAQKPLPKPFRIAPALREDLLSPEISPQSVLLINPFYAKDPNSSFGKHVLTPTLALTSVAATTPEQWSVQIWDENLLQGHPPTEPFPAVVGITVHLTFAARAYELADWYRKRGSKIILGGLHVQSCTDECRPYADALVLGEGVQVWSELLTDIDNDELKPTYSGSFKKQYRKEPAPRRELLEKRQFLTRTSMIASRGCHNRCNFCYLSTEGMHMPYQMLEVEQIVRQVETEKAKYIVFTDNNLGSRPKFLYALCDALETLNIIWSCAISIDVTDDPALVKRMAQSGCTGVFVGFESLNEDSMIYTGKNTPMPHDYARRVKIFHSVGIQINGSFVLGFDHDKPEVFEKTIAWIEENKLESGNFQILTPYPGTPLFKQMEEEGRILHKDWSKYDTGHVVFEPKHMTPEELQTGYEQVYQRHNSFKSIWVRRPEHTSSVLPYLGSAYLYRKANWLWYFLIKHNLTNAVWEPLVELNRLHHVLFRKSLDAKSTHSKIVAIPPSV
jgi:radical SAM superfamily enzyme YgiQ (UPF0313 family)